MSGYLVPFLVTACWVIAVFLALSSLFGFWGRLWWRFELFSHFRLQYLLGAMVLLSAFILLDQRAGAALAGGLAVLNLALILPLYRRQAGIPAGGEQYTLVFANVLGTNQRYDLIRQLIQSERADLFLFIEARSALLEALTPHLAEYPYRCLYPKEDNYGIALFSRLPIEEAQERMFTSQGRPALVARLKLAGKALTIIGAHPPPPKNRFQAGIRNQQMNAIAHFAANQAGEVLLLGDLNTTSWSPWFGEILRLSRLRDSRQGFGLQPSWPVNMPVFFIPIDHALHSAGIHVHQRRTRQPIGSDHLPVRLEISLDHQQHGKDQAETRFKDTI